MKLMFPELTFSAAHYIPGHPKCQRIHGHTYFVRNLEIEFNIDDIDLSGMFEDFGMIKHYFDSWDHTLIIPAADIEKWLEVKKKVPSLFRWLSIHPVPTVPTAETMVCVMHQELSIMMQGAKSISLELYEGPNQGVKFP